jgi:hypothetical protein
MRRHAGIGLLGAALALAACDYVDLGDPPADVNACRPSQRYFVEQIWPMVLSVDYGGKHCYDATCHGVSSANSLRLTTDNLPPGTDAMGMIAVPLPLTMAWEANYRATAEQMNCSNVAASKLLALPSGQRPHGGGKLFEPTGPEAGLITAWVEAAP